MVIFWQLFILNLKLTTLILFFIFFLSYQVTYNLLYKYFCFLFLYLSQIINWSWVSKEFFQKQKIELKHQFNS